MGTEQMTAEQKKAEARLREMDAQLELLNAKADRMKADAQANAKKTLEDIRGKRDAVLSKLEDARKTAGSAAGQVGEGLQKAVDDISQSLDRAAAEFKQDESN